MEFIDRIKDNAIGIIDAFSGSVPACLFLSSITALVSIFIIRVLVGALFAMHRGRSKIKKIQSRYGFWKRLLMKPAWDECLHAKNFCRVLIVCHHIRMFLLISTLFLVAISNWVPNLLQISGRYAGLSFLIMDFPILVMHLVLDRYPFQRLKHEYRFWKYHNTKNYDSLF